MENCNNNTIFYKLGYAIDINKYLNKSNLTAFDLYAVFCVRCLMDSTFKHVDCISYLLASLLRIISLVTLSKCLRPPSSHYRCGGRSKEKLKNTKVFLLYQWKRIRGDHTEDDVEEGMKCDRKDKIRNLKEWN